MELSSNNTRSSRETMVQNQIVRRGVKDISVLKAMLTVPREAFMPEDVSVLAYEDMPAPIGEGQTISQPYIVAMMAELAKLQSTDKVLEIGTGSGYGAAVLSHIAGEVYTIERHEVLAEHAKRILRKLGYDNIQVIKGDGTQGLPDRGPFDAIIVTAGAPGVPEILQEQLAIGGRLVIPTGSGSYQHLLQVRRTGERTFETEDHGAVRFVPLIGEYGWQDENKFHHALPSSLSSIALTKENKENTSVHLLKQEVVELPDPTSPHFAQNFDHLAKADVVLLGESTHGTAEFYRARAALTQYLVRNHGFNVIALEADWPDVAILDGYARNRNVPDIGQPAFARFPEWMWRNEEFRMLVRWLRKFNDRQGNHENKVALYGLDLYSLQASIHAVIDFLDQKNPELAALARNRYGCFKPWLEDPASYGSTIITADFLSCEKQAVEMLLKLMREREIYADGYEDNYLDVIRNAMTVMKAEQYYRVIYRGSAESWNLRDRHMFDTLQVALQSKGGNAKAIVWAHNSHLGDARATEMGRDRGEFNLGQLCREHYGHKVRLVGFGTASGEVAAATHWGGKMEVKTLRDPLPGSIEKLWQDTKINHGFLQMDGLGADLQKEMENTFLQRAIGVIYRPGTERISHYFETMPAQQFDDYIWFRKTHAVTPLPHIPETGAAETYPFGL